MSSGSKGLRDQEDTPSFGPNLRCFHAIGFLGSLALDDVLMNILGNNVSRISDDGKPFKVSTTTPMTRVSVHVPKP